MRIRVSLSFLFVLAGGFGTTPLLAQNACAGQTFTVSPLSFHFPAKVDYFTVYKVNVSISPGTPPGNVVNCWWKLVVPNSATAWVNAPQPLGLTNEVDFNVFNNCPGQPARSMTLEIWALDLTRGIVGSSPVAIVSLTQDAGPTIPLLSNVKAAGNGSYIIGGNLPITWTYTPSSDSSISDVGYVTISNATTHTSYGQFTVDLTTQSYTWAIPATTPPGTYTITIVWSDDSYTNCGAIAGNATSAPFEIANEAVTLTCSTNTGTVGTPYSSPLSAADGTPPYTFSISNGSLPAGLALNANTGAISGRPTSAGTSNFTAKVVDSQANSATAACAIAVVKITMDSLEITQPATPNAVDGTVPAIDALNRTNTSATFAAADSADLVVVLLNSGTVTVNGVNVQPAASANQVQWQMDRDPTDKVDLTANQGCAGAPKGAPAVAGSPGAQVTFPPDNPGNFRLVAYIDANGNGKFDDGEQLRILQIAVVRATLLNPATSTFNITSRFVANTPEPGKEKVLVRDPAGGPAMKIMGDYMIEGGGGTCKIGVTAITIGNIGNLTDDTFVVSYPGPPAGTATESPGGVLPMIDASGVAKGTQPQGGATPFRRHSKSPDDDNQPATGRRVRLESDDGPDFGRWKVVHPATGKPWETTSGGNVFHEFVVGYSENFKRTYSSLNENSYTLIVKGKNDGTGKWTDDGSSSTSTNNETSLGTVKDKVQVLGLSFATNYTFTCNPAPPAGVTCR